MGKEDYEEKEDYFYQEKEKEDADDDSIYSETVIGRLVEDDELTGGEEGFMLGYLDA